LFKLFFTFDLQETKNKLNFLRPDLVRQIE